MRKLMMVLMVAFMAGCATPPSPYKKQEALDTMPYCSGQADCTAKWDAAQLWVVKHCGYKIQSATNVIIETYNGQEADIELHGSVTKEPLGGGKYKIVGNFGCNNFMGCTVDPWDALIDFNHYVGAAAP